MTRAKGQRSSCRRSDDAMRKPTEARLRETIRCTVNALWKARYRQQPNRVEKLQRKVRELKQTLAQIETKRHAEVF
jgi:hypothetical protein